MIQGLQSLSGIKRQLAAALAWLAVALYALAPAVPQQWMPALAFGVHHEASGPAHHDMAAMPDDCGMDAADMQAGAAPAKPRHAAGHECPICKVAAAAVTLATPPALPTLAPDARGDGVAGPTLAPSQPVLAAQPRGPPSQS